MNDNKTSDGGFVYITRGELADFSRDCHCCRSLPQDRLKQADKPTISFTMTIGAVTSDVEEMLKAFASFKPNY